MTTPRVQAYLELVEAIEDLPEEDDVHLVAAQLAESEPEFAALTTEMRRVAIALRKLDDLMPLERDIENDVQETLVLERSFQNHRTSSSDILRVENSLGAREIVRKWPASLAYAPEVDLWAHCRETSEIKDSLWDKARKERFVVDLKIGRKVAIDRGLNFAYDLIQKAECEITGGSEGHPGGAFICFDGCGSAFFELTDEFERVGWRVHFDEEMPSFVTVRMPQVHTVEARDAEWRKLARDFNYDILLQTGLTPR
ncbi:hypothetical protein [Mesorhizobium sp. SP-1A]|uniref:hypothetical protein n=1 Tax=Mesorhizobium sp. SP-1A TaxID=3077840 RepID=UPI0028F6D514|nr:hypothetical protein [Mesorhizobium sp. SP-1A]